MTCKQFIFNEIRNTTLFITLLRGTTSYLFVPRLLRGRGLGIEPAPQG